jgi:hypothetical protein
VIVIVIITTVILPSSTTVEHSIETSSIGPAPEQADVLVVTPTPGHITAQQCEIYQFHK